MSPASLRNSLRAFASVVLLFAALGITITGLVLFIVPPGRIANWTGWTFAGLTKQDWGAVHQWSALLFVLATVLHVWLNWRPLLGYFRLSGRGRHWAWLPATALCFIVFVGAASGWPLFEWLPEWNESIKQGYDRSSRQPAFHAELFSLRQLADQQNLALDTAIARLEEAGVEADPDLPLGKIAQDTDRTPQELFAIAAGRPLAGGGGQGAYEGETGEDHGAGGGGGGAGMGYGRMTVEQAARDAGVPTEDAVARLRESGAADASAETPLRDLSSALDLHPRDVYGIIAGE